MHDGAETMIRQTVVIGPARSADAVHAIGGTKPPYWILPSLTR
jgi:hypothetical protein